MINVLDSVKTEYKSDSIPKKYFVTFRDYGQMKDNGQITSESLQITESICSAGNFKVGLCESASCKVSLVIDSNVNGDEITIFQVLGEFEPEITNPITKTDNIQLLGAGLTKLNTTFTSSNIINGLDSENFSKEEDYLLLAKLKYIGNPIYLYLETSQGTSRTIYYLKSGLYNFSNLETWDSTKTYAENVMVLHNGFVWQSKAYNNTTEPGTLVNGELINTWENITRYVQVAIPIIGSEFYEYKKAVYVNTNSEYGVLAGQADIYKLDYPIMPLGLFTVKSCKRANDNSIRNIEAYDRMQDVGLDVDVYYNDTDTSTTGFNIQVGQVLDEAAENTQIVIGSNLSKQIINPNLINDEIVSFSSFPTGNIYKVIKNEEQEVQGTYSEVQSANCSLDYTRTEQKTLEGTYVNNGNYSHTQMQIIDGNLDESATSSNKEFSTVIRKTIKASQCIDSDNSNWTTYKNAGKLRQVGTRRQTKTLDGIIIDSDNYNWTTTNLNNGKIFNQTANTGWVHRQRVTENDTWVQQYRQTQVEHWDIYGWRTDDDWQTQYEVWETYYDESFRYDSNLRVEDETYYSNQYTWTTTKNWSYSVGSKKNFTAYNSATSTSSKEFTVLSGGIGTESNWSTSGSTRTKTRPTTFTRDTSYGYYYSSYDSAWTKGTQTWDEVVDKTNWKTYDSSATKYYNAYLKSHYTVYRDTSYGYYYSDNLDSSWSIQTSEYYTGINNKSGWVTTTGAAIKEYAYLDLYKAYYWKYTWDSLDTKTSADTAWTAYGTGTTFQYQSRTSGSSAKYKIASERPAKASWYTSLNTLYTDTAVYKKMSRRYTRTHKYDYTFANAGTGWAAYHNPNSDAYNNYVKNTSQSNLVYKGVTLADQYNVGMYSATNVYYSLARDYRRTVKYGYLFTPPEGGHWLHPNADYNEENDKFKYTAGQVINGITYLENVYNIKRRLYVREVTYTWQESAVLKKMTYEIPANVWDSSMAYTVYITYPTDSIAYLQENTVRELAMKQVGSFEDTEISYSATGVLETDRQNEVRNAIVTDSTKVAEVGNDRKFYIYWVYSLKYDGYIKYNNESAVADYSVSGVIYAANPYQRCIMHNTAEKFNSMQITCAKESVHGTRRNIIAGFMEIHGLFINFDRWGISTTRNVSASTLYPAENLYPHDSTIPGYSGYGDIYPSVGSTEVTDVSICKSIYIDDDLNNEFDGVVISKSSTSADEAGLYPFYYNRQNKRYGALPSGMPEVAHTPWEGNNYYRLDNNFFINNFIFTENQLKEICKQIISNIGNLQYFNLTAQLRSLPYMEVGDNIDIMTPKNGYETVILRRVMKGCLAQMDSIETDFY